ncbi:alpha/beta fold hydrolase [Telmatospirillum siberiense]|uniref:Alpha/beta hydrolase n=1 Tax=Telmatospirillum siberiense TaxID=382514 RepID=A0A2N3PRF8_9PROT|nr:alpha/beta hydrolase [Telmatospirillum siberiense]PKU22983.1 alpha/beta hydrolase [Telmatospirillum siberiense]
MIGKQSTIRVNGVDLSVVDRGEGQPTLVFLHYWGGSTETWSDTIDHLSENHRCIAFDFRGWGESGKGLLDYGLDALARDTLALIAQIGLTNYVLIGHSMGGKVAQIVAAQRPSGLLGLILVAPAPPTPLHTPPEARAQIRECLDSREGVYSVFPTLAHGELKDEHKDLVVRNSLAGDPAAKDSWLKAGMDYDITHLAPKVVAPIVVVIGSHDVVETEGALRTAFDRYYPGTEYVVIEHTGHLIPLQAPGELASAINGVAAGFSR